MPIDRASLTPQQRLAISRRALFRQFEDESADDDHPAPYDYPPAESGVMSNLPWLTMARSVGQRWWRRHPANALGHLAQPVLARYARQKPAKLMAIAAGTGAVLVLVKPWRLLSITAIVAAVLKTSDVADMVTTLMHNNSTPRKDPS